MVEYALVVTGVVLVSIAGVAYVSARVGGLIGITVENSMPGSHPNDNGPIDSNNLVEMYDDPALGRTIDFDEIVARSDGATGRLAEQFGVDSANNPFPDQIINAQLP
jgi:hypothetical protein